MGAFKKNLPASIIGILILFSGYLLLDNSKLRKQIAMDEKKPVGACVPCTDYSTVPPLQKLDARMLQNMANNYFEVVRNGVTLTNGNTLAEDSRSIWFDLDSVKHFIWQIENDVCNNKNKCAEKNAVQIPDMKLGLRIYYARYPDTAFARRMNFSQLYGLPETYQFHHTIFMVPTYEQTQFSIGPVDFDPDNYNTDSCIYNKIRPSTETTGYRIRALAGTSAAMPPGASANTAMNHGGICPPVCKPPTGTAFAQ